MWKWSIIAVFLLMILVCHTAKVYVSNKKNVDAAPCGKTLETACPTIQVALDNAKPNSDITIVATKRSYTGCPIVIRKPFTFSGYGGLPAIDCASKNDAFNVKFNQSDKKFQKAQYVRILIQNLEFRNARAAILLKNIKKRTLVHILTSVFQDNEIDIHIQSSNVFGLALTNVILRGKSGYGIWAANFNDLNIVLKETKFYGKFMQVVSAAKQIKVVMENVTFDTSERRDGFKDAAFYIETSLKKTVVSIKDSSFLNYRGETNSSFKIQTPRSTIGMNLTKTSIVVTFLGVNFFNNSATSGSGGAFVFNTTLAKDQARPQITFKDCTFTNNTAYHQGGALWFGQWVSKSVRFTKCVFSGNRVYGNHGQGGAIFAEAGSYDLIKSHFIGNTATQSGGTLHFVTCTARIVDSAFKTTHVSVHAVQGEVIYMTKGNAWLRGNVTFDLLSPNFQKPIMWYNGYSAVLFMENLTSFTCPTGYNYEEIEDAKRLKRGKYSVFGFTCVPCHDLFYTASRGYHQVNGNDRVAKCYRCPEGASCNGTIRALANYWGMVQGSTIKMYQCPNGYCCDKEPCKSYNYCNEHRTGTLCGECKEGFSDRVSTVSCYSNEKCTTSGIWVLFIEIFGISIFLMFHHEVITNATKFVGYLVKPKPKQYRQGLADEAELETETLPLQSSSTSNRVYSNPEREIHACNNITPTDQETNANESTLPSPVLQFPRQNPCIKKSELYNRNSAYIKVFFYFYQILIYLRVTHSPLGTPNDILNFATPFLNFQFSDGISGCVFKSLTPVKKVLIKNTVCCWILAVFLVFYVVYLIERKRRIRRYFGAPDDLPLAKARSFPVRLTGCVIHVLLLSYLALIQLCISLIHCVQVGDQKVLHIDGNIQCYQSFQIIIWLFFIFYVWLFPLVLFFGRKFLISGQIPPRLFLLSCVFPPFLFGHWLWFNRTKRQPVVGNNNPFKEKILYILQHPYREPKLPDSMTIAEHMAQNWECVLMIRRLIIVMVFIFVDSLHLRSMLIFFSCCCILLHHLLVQPFVHKSVNGLETISLLIIVFFTGIDIADASFTVAGTERPPSVTTIESIRDLLMMPVLPCFLVLIVVVRFIHASRRSKDTPSESSGANTEVETGL